jgi:hypothetical protein
MDGHFIASIYNCGTLCLIKAEFNNLMKDKINKILLPFNVVMTVFGVYKFRERFSVWIDKMG